MKRSCVFILLSGLGFAGCHSLQTGEPTGLIQPGSTLTYNVERGDKCHQFIVSLKTREPEITFDWKMTEPVNSAGDVTISAQTHLG